MELKYKENLGDLVTDEQIEERNRIMQKLNNDKIPTKKECMFLMDFERKTRICYTCGKSVEDAKGWIITNLEEYPELEIGYHFRCLECDMRHIVEEDSRLSWQSS